MKLYSLEETRDTGEYFFLMLTQINEIFMFRLMITEKRDKITVG